MRPRSELHTILLTLCDNVYFQPPANVSMSYPAIRYERSDEDTRYANDKPYSQAKRYTLTIMDTNPDSDIPEKVRMLPYCRFDRFYTADDLNHDVYNLFF